jgi:hypothetical protein
MRVEKSSRWWFLTNLILVINARKSRNEPFVVSFLRLSKIY